jgi:capsular exopolysaccharide synthesis family protein
MINKFAPTVYEVSSTIGPVEDKRTTLLESNSLFNGVGPSVQERNLENDINSLTSFSLVSTTIKNLNLEIGYFVENKNIFDQSRQIYGESPYIVNIDKSHIQPINTRISIKILDNNSYKLTASESDVTLYNYVDNQIVSKHNVLNIDTVCRFNETINNRYLKISISRNNEVLSLLAPDKGSYYFELYHLDILSHQYLKKLKVELVNIKSSLINVSFRGENIYLTIDFLNRYLQEYLADDLSKKNKIALNTINFIDGQISKISDSLQLSESKLKDYRSANQVTDLSYQGQKALEQMNQNETERSSLKAQERYYNYILDYFSKNKDMSGIYPPSAANVVDPILNKLITDLLALNQDRSNILSNNTDKNLFLGQIENKIKLQKQAITENVTNNLNTLNLTQNELNYRAEKLSNEISKLPRTELNMVSMQRKFNLSDAIYTFLLQKRSEAAITMASNFPDYEVLEPARDILKQVISPKKTINWILAIFLAFMFPTGYLILKKFFNDKITSVYDTEHLLNRPVLSVIYSNTYKTEAVVYEFPSSSVAESFRNLRSNMFLRFKSEPIKVIMVTSTQPQDGKSFIAFNLAASIASVGHKTVIIDCDLRRPTLHEKFKQDNSSGLSTFMTNHRSIDEIIHETFIKNLSFIPAGPILPNPSELVESGVLDELIEYLKRKFDYIIIDTTPAGLVADASLMMKYASLTLLVCRNNYTRKDIFSDVLSMFSTNKIEKYDVIFNDLSLKKSRYGHYDNYYKEN